MVTDEELQPRFYFVAGEVSGDRHSAELLRALRKLYPECRVGGVGGKHLKSAGQDQLFDMTEHAVVGLTDVIPKYFTFLRFFRRILEDLGQKMPDVLILVDYPGFNLKLAKEVRMRWPRMKIVYYISPQVWAWRSQRSRKMAEWLDLLLVILPFEEKWFREHAPKLNVKWIGHPILDRWQEASTEVDSDPEKKFKVALLPGSRSRELKAHLPILLRAARMLTRYASDRVSFTLLVSNRQAKEWVEEIMEEELDEHLTMEIQEGYQLTHLKRCSLAWVASGTATLECCLANLPMLVLYRVSPLTYWVGKLLVQVPYLSIVNILANEKIVPEFLQGKAHEDYLFEAARRVMEQPVWAVRMKEKLSEVAKTLGKPGVSDRGAHAIRKLVEESASKQAVVAPSKPEAESSEVEAGPKAAS